MVNKKILSRNTASVIIFCLVGLAVVNFLINAWMTEGPRVFYLDDLEAYVHYQDFKSQNGIWRYVFDFSGQKIRPVMNILTILVFELIGKNYEWLDVILLIFNAINSMVLFGIIRHLLQGNKWRNILAFVGGCFFIGSHFAYYCITEFWGIMESAGIFCGLLILYCLLDFVAKNQKDIRYLVLANVFYVIICYIHERYFLLVGAFLVAVICKYGKKVRKWSYFVPTLIIFVLFWIVRISILGAWALNGTGGQNISDTFNILQVLTFIVSQVAYILGINCGPSYLNGIEQRYVSWPINIMIITSIIIVVIIVIKRAMKLKEENWLNLKYTLVFIAFIGCCILSSSTTIRVEMRWIYISYAAFLIMMFINFGRILENTLNVRRWIFLGTVYFVCVCSFEMYYRNHYNNIYYWPEMLESKSLYNETIGEYGEEFVNAKTILIDKTGKWTMENWKRFFSPYVDTDNLKWECVMSITDAEQILNAGDIVLLYNDGKYMDISDQLDSYSFISGYYDDTWVESQVELQVNNSEKRKLIINYFSYAEQTLSIEINGEKANYTEQLNVGSGQIEIPLDSGTNNVKLISDYGIQLSDTDKRVCSYLISSVDLQ